MGNTPNNVYENSVPEIMFYLILEVFILFYFVVRVEYVSQIRFWNDF